MPKIDMTGVPVKTGSIYPAPHAAKMAGRSSLRLGQAGGLTRFGANLVTLAPGARSSLRHWHAEEDEFVMVTAGSVVLVENGGETIMEAGDCAAFPAGVADGHSLENRFAAPVRFLVVGSKALREVVTYSDVDLVAVLQDGTASFSRRDGTPLAEEGT